jgi:Na+-translocating ferredoxin:NAD+ oxidoreductase subunit B
VDILYSILLITAGILCMGVILGIASVLLKVKSDPIVDKIEALLPQTQCGQCSHPGCRPYAQAIANGEDINKCPPGGQATIEALADLLGREVMHLDATHGEEKPKTVAVIREPECIGCTKCIQACPVDAILGAAKQMHTVIALECTGCDLCVAPCPVDCIDMVPIKTPASQWLWPLPQTGAANNYPQGELIATSRV